jgi:hypothetical protein
MSCSSLYDILKDKKTITKRQLCAEWEGS